MFIVKILSVLLWAVIVSVMVSILFWGITVAATLINGIKKQIIWAFFDRVVHLELYSAQKRYRREIVETGYSMRLSCRSNTVYHYRYTMVFDGTYRNVFVRFANAITIKINIKEESLLYKKLLSA